MVWNQINTTIYLPVYHFFFITSIFLFPSSSFFIDIISILFLYFCRNSYYPDFNFFDFFIILSFFFLLNIVFFSLYFPWYNVFSNVFETNANIFLSYHFLYFFIFICFVLFILQCWQPIYIRKEGTKNWLEALYAMNLQENSQISCLGGINLSFASVSVHGNELCHIWGWKWLSLHPTWCPSLILQCKSL